MGVLLAGCITGRGAVSSASPEREWPTVLARAQAAAGGRQYGDAERILREFAARFPGSDEAVETAYWRGLLTLDPENRDASTRTAVALLESYLENDRPLAHRLEADLLRRLALRIDALSVALGPSAASVLAPGGTPQTVSSGDRTPELKAKDAEIAKLKEELAKANDELERIKKRLAQPTKTP